MKLREKVLRYSVGKHGKDYVDPTVLVPVLCPDCQSLNIHKHEEGEECFGVYVCRDCGCEFDQWIGSERTKAGKVINKLLTVLCVMFVIGVVCSLFAGLIYSEYLDRVVYPDGSCPDALKLRTIGISVLGPIIGMVMAAITANLSEKV